jgi:hypothetical protein
MKLTSAQVERTLTQFEGDVIPDNHPVVPQLNSMFGEHTFFLEGVRGLELRGANYPFERSLRFPGSQPNSGHGDPSRLSCARCSGSLFHTCPPM